MQIQLKHWTEKNGWADITKQEFEKPPQLVLAFGGRIRVEDVARYSEIKDFYPEAEVVMASTSGEIVDTRVYDDSIGLAAISFEKSEVRTVQGEITDAKDSEEVGKKLGETLEKEGLVHVMVFSDGLKVNGTSLVRGLISSLPELVSVTGGLVGDGADFKKTALGLNAAATGGKVVLVGFYGSSLQIGYGSLGGWDDFGLVRTISKAENNVLYELDGEPALALYKKYLGDKAVDLPASGLLFPMSLELEDGSSVVRTLLAIDEEAQSLTFAGDMPVGIKARLMKANFDRLIDGAEGAAKMGTGKFGPENPDLAILISCVGRKLVLKERIEEETEAVKTVLGGELSMIGFYSYGEISPVAATETKCRLHNQTMTITLFKE